MSVEKQHFLADGNCGRKTNEQTIQVALCWWKRKKKQRKKPDEQNSNLTLATDKSEGEKIKASRVIKISNIMYQNNWNEGKRERFFLRFFCCV